MLFGALLALTAALCLGAQALLVRLGTVDGRSFDVLAGVLVVNVAILVPLAAVTASGPALGLTVTAFLAFVAAGIVGTLLGRIFYFAAIGAIGATRTEPIKASQPLHAVLIAVVVLGETVTPGHVFGIVLVTVGVAYVSWTTQTDPEAPDVSRRDLLLPLAAAFFLGLEPTFAKTGFAEGTAPVVGLAIKSLVAAVIVCGYLAWERRARLVARLRAGTSAREGRHGHVRLSILAAADPRRWIRAENARWYVAAGVANSAFLLAYYGALNVAPVGVVVPIIQTSPVLIAGLSYVFIREHERVTPSLVAGTLVVVTGAITVVHFG